MALKRFRLQRGGSSPDGAKVEQIASDACTRSGLFGLALSLSLLALFPQWAEERAEAALGKYVLNRWELRLALDELDTNPDWHRRLAAEPSLSKLSIAKLEKVDLSERPEQAASGAVPATVKIKLQTSDPSSAPPPTPAAAPFPVLASAPVAASSAAPQVNWILDPPMAPTNLMVKFDRNEFPAIAKTLRELNDPTLLTLARSADATYDVLIYRWQRRTNLELTDNPYTSETDPGLVGLSLEQVRGIAAFEYPKVETGSAKFSRGKRVDVAVGALPRNLFVAAVVLEGMLAFTLAYFAAFALEAMHSPTFPSHGTLFAAFRRSRVTVISFAAALLAPAVASVAVAVASQTITMAVFAIAVATLTAWLLRRLAPYYRKAVP